MKHLLVLGPGYTARRFLLGFGNGFASIHATMRAGSISPLPAGVTGVRLSGSPDQAFPEAVADATHILVTAAPGENGDPFLALMDAALRAHPGSRVIVYLSTVGVYGNHDGRWIDETVEPHPSQGRSRHRLEAESGWRELAARHGATLAVLRLPGIYGPGRSALDDVRAGEARRIDKPGQVFNRVHVDDIASAIDLAFERRAEGVFNITDDSPSPPQDVVAHAATLLGVEPPPLIPFAEATLSPMGRSFYGENKRVSNALAKERLGWQPAYPSYREGLAALHEAAR